MDEIIYYPYKYVDRSQNRDSKKNKSYLKYGKFYFLSRYLSYLPFFLNNHTFALFCLFESNC